MEKIIELVGEIEDKQEKYMALISRTNNGKSSSPPRKRLQWVPKKQSFKVQVKEKKWINKNKSRNPKEESILDT